MSAKSLSDKIYIFIWKWNIWVYQTEEFLFMTDSIKPTPFLLSLPFLSIFMFAYIMVCLSTHIGDCTKGGNSELLSKTRGQSEYSKSEIMESALPHSRERKDNGNTMEVSPSWEGLLEWRGMWPGNSCILQGCQECLEGKTIPPQIPSLVYYRGTLFFFFPS